MQSMMVAGGATVLAESVSAQQPAAHGRKLTTVRSALSTTENPTPGNRSRPTTTSMSSAPTRATRPSTRRAPPASALDCGHRGRVRQTGPSEPRRHPQRRNARGPHLSPALRREGWSMVIPWVGFPLANLIKRRNRRRRRDSSSSPPSTTPDRCAVSAATCWSGPYVEGLRSMKRCIR